MEEKKENLTQEQDIEIPIRDASEDAPEEPEKESVTEEASKAEKAADEEKPEETDTEAPEMPADEAPEEKTEETAEDTPEETQEPAADEKDPEKEADTAEDVPEEKEEPAPEKKGFFGRKKEAKELAALKEKNAELEDRVRRQMAEFENFRKRSDKEKNQMFSMGEMSVLEKLLPVIDNFERGFDTVAEEDKDDAFVDGMHKIYAQLMKQMEDIGVKPIEALGKEFDPNFHNAVMQIESEEYESGIVGQELLKGYMYHDTVLRHSMVGVVK
ncbi:MAG: nucleotide exchange factor GrpE [Lachnospiraceae bacterium]|nr:nucleotide exchange factor GrpE [Lachnospiraceae bacterium]